VHSIFSDSDPISAQPRISCSPHLTVYKVIYQCKAFSISFVYKTAATLTAFSDSRKTDQRT